MGNDHASHGHSSPRCQRKMSLRRLEHETFLLQLLAYGLNIKQKKAVLFTLDRNQLHVLRELILNILQGTIPVGKNDKLLIERDKSFLRQFAASRRSQSTRKLGSKVKLFSRLAHITLVWLGLQHRQRR